MQAVKAGNYLKGLVAMVGGSTSGFSAVIGAYVTTITVTIAVVAICLGLAVCMYCARADQKLRADAAYGGAQSSLGTSVSAPVFAEETSFLPLQRACRWEGLLPP